MIKFVMKIVKGYEKNVYTISKSFRVINIGL